MNITKEFIDQSIFRIHENTPRIEKCLNELSEEDIWRKPNASSNSIGNLVLHLCGNITQYIIASLGHKKDNRNRGLEFSSLDRYNKWMLISKLKTTIDLSVDILNQLTEADLMEVRRVQCFDLSGIGIIIHVTEHYSYHTGQIAFWTKILKDKDLQFYGAADLNKRNTTIGNKDGE